MTIAAGSTTADIVVSVRNDSLVESTETVIVTLSAVTSGDPDITIDQANKTATVSILDDPTTVSIAATSPTASEPGAQKGQFTVSLASGRQAPLGGIQVSYTVSGSAAAGTDYTALSGVATIPAGQSSVQISVDVLNDNVVELPETVSVTLTGTNHPSVAIDPAGNQATVTINDDDPDDGLDCGQRSQRQRAGHRRRTIHGDAGRRHRGPGGRHRRQLYRQRHGHRRNGLYGAWQAR